jgi:hypothetical protein
MVGFLSIQEIFMLKDEMFLEAGILLIRRFHLKW